MTNLQDKQKHYLLKIMEESMEVGQRASKAIQFGLEEVQPDQPLTNRERLIDELNDLFCVVEIGLGCSIRNIIDDDKMRTKYLKVEKYREYQKTLEE